MAGSPVAAKRANGEAVAPSSYRCRRFFVVGALLADLSLAACGTPPSAIVAPPSAAAAVLPAPAAPAVAPAAPAAARIPELPVLTGLGPAELVALFGEPDFRRRDPPAELWQYRSPDCVLDVFLYGEGGSYRVVRSETRDRHVLPPQVAACAAGFDRRPPESRL